jgi:hypothetical protein
MIVFKRVFSSDMAFVLISPAMIFPSITTGSVHDVPEPEFKARRSPSPLQSMGVLLHLIIVLEVNDPSGPEIFFRSVPCKLFQS